MKLNIIRLNFVVLILSITAPLISQETGTEPRWLTLLRGTWEYPTYEEVHTIKFLSDSKLIEDRIASRYSLNDDTLIISNDNSVNKYTFILEEHRLFMKDTKGKVRTFKRKAFGENESMVNGSYYPDNETNQNTLNFDFTNGVDVTLSKVQNYSATEPTTGWLIKSGIYRVEGNKIIFLFDDGTAEYASIRFHTSEELVDGFIYQDYLYEKELLLSEEVEEPLEDNVQTRPPQRPGGFTTIDVPVCPAPISPIHPHPPSTPVAIPVSVPSPPQEEKKREFGTMRPNSSTADANNDRKNQPTRRGDRP